jgi:sugar O-acyltransferase (sialic acid O-acetyltransferase NeuD family)
MTEIAIYGAGGFGQEVNLILQQLIKKGHPYYFLGYFDDKDHSKELGRHYLGGIDELNSWNEKVSIVIACGDGKLRRSIKESIKNPNVLFPSIISPHAILNDITEVGAGSIVCAGANLTTQLIIKEFVVINLNATIGHHCILEAYSSVMPGANLAGNVCLEEASFVGSGANVLNGVKLHKDSTLGAGAVLTKNLDAGDTAIGVPAKTWNNE